MRHVIELEWNKPHKIFILWNLLYLIPLMKYEPWSKLKDVGVLLFLYYDYIGSLCTTYEIYYVSSSFLLLKWFFPRILFNLHWISLHVFKKCNSVDSIEKETKTAGMVAPPYFLIVVEIQPTMHMSSIFYFFMDFRIEMHGIREKSQYTLWISYM